MQSFASYLYRRPTAIAWLAAAALGATSTAHSGVVEMQQTVSPALHASSSLIQWSLIGSTQHISTRDLAEDTMLSAYMDGAGAELLRADPLGGLHLVKDICPGPCSSYPRSMVVLGDTLIFTASSPEAGRRLWTSDGTRNGTRPLFSPDIDPVSPYGGSSIFDAPAQQASYLVFNNKLYFQGIDADYGSELWVTDGTRAGTQRVSDISPGAGDAEPHSLTLCGDDLCFLAHDGSAPSLYRMNTSQVVSAVDAPWTLAAEEIVGASSSHLFWEGADDNGDKQLYAYLLASLPESPIIDGIFFIENGNGAASTFRVAHEHLYFIHATGSPARHIWQSDGSIEGTVPFLPPELEGATLTDVVDSIGDDLIVYAEYDTPVVAGTEFYAELAFYDGATLFNRRPTERGLVNALQNTGTSTLMVADFVAPLVRASASGYVVAEHAAEPPGNALFMASLDHAFGFRQQSQRYFLRNLDGIGEDATLDDMLAAIAKGEVGRLAWLDDALNQVPLSSSFLTGPIPSDTVALDNTLFFSTPDQALHLITGNRVLNAQSWLTTLPEPVIPVLGGEKTALFKGASGLWGLSLRSRTLSLVRPADPAESTFVVANALIGVINSDSGETTLHHLNDELVLNPIETLPIDTSVYFTGDETRHNDNFWLYSVGDLEELSLHIAGRHGQGITTPPSLVSSSTHLVSVTDENDFLVLLYHADSDSGELWQVDGNSGTPVHITSFDGKPEQSALATNNRFWWTTRSNTGQRTLWVSAQTADTTAEQADSSTQPLKMVAAQSEQLLYTRTGDDTSEVVVISEQLLISPVRNSLNDTLYRLRASENLDGDAYFTAWAAGEMALWRLPENTQQAQLISRGNITSAHSIDIVGKRDGGFVFAATTDTARKLFSYSKGSSGSGGATTWWLYLAVALLVPAWYRQLRRSLNIYVIERKQLH